MISASGSGHARGVVAAGHELTASAAARILAEGGTAIDGAIAAMAMACVCEPVLASPGGGGFAMTRNCQTGHLSLLDFFPHTPRVRRQEGDAGSRTVLADFGTATQAFRIGPATVATPGFAPGIAALHRQGATMPLIDLFAPAIEAAIGGVTMTGFQEFLTSVVAAIWTADDGPRSLVCHDGHLLTEGDVMVNPGLAEALTIMAASGTAGGDDPVGDPVAAALLESQVAEGNLTADDIRGYEVVERAPLSVKIGSDLVHLNPFPAAGGVLIEHSLRQLESAEPIEVAEAFRATARARAAATDEAGRLDPALLRTQGTTHISVIDSDGSACAVTVSNGAGNGELVDGYGFMLNNILGENDLNPTGPGHWPVDTRLSSMMCPTIVEQADGGVIALGSGGSNRIRTAISQVVAHLCLGGADLAGAVEAPRLHVEGEHLDFEDLVDPGIRQALCERFPDHLAWPDRDLFYGGVHSVRRASDGRMVGHGDPRRHGVALLVD